MKCADVRRKAPFYLDSELSTDASLDVARHLETCGACRRRVDGEARLEAAFRRALGSTGDGERAAMRRAIEASVRPTELRPAHALAALVLAALVGVLSVRAARAPQLAPDPAPLHPVPEMLEAMKPTTVLGAAVCVSIASAAATAALIAPSAAPSGPGARGAGAELSDRLAELTRQQEELRSTIAALRAELDSRGGASSRTPAIDDAAIERAVARVLAERDLATVVPATPPVPGSAQRVLADLVSDLLDPRLSDEERARIWRELRERGLLDEAVAAFERRADAAPYDPAARAELAGAYFQKMLSESGPEAGRWGARAADALLGALELDPTFWDARFALARHYSHAGLRGDSIRHLETLVGQDAERVPEAGHADAYLLLGNLHMDMGRTEEALAAWRDGLLRHPNDTALLERLQAFE